MTEKWGREGRGKRALFRESSFEVHIMINKRVRKRIFYLPWVKWTKVLTIYLSSTVS